jgi:hypothetical protein
MTSGRLPPEQDDPTLPRRITIAASADNLCRLNDVPEDGQERHAPSRASHAEQCQRVAPRLTVGYEYAAAYPVLCHVAAKQFSK